MSKFELTSKTMGNYIWPKIFITGIEPKETKESKDRNRILCADALMGRGLCHVTKPPDNFGKGMVIIGTVLGCGTSPNAIKEYADKLLNTQD